MKRYDVAWSEIRQYRRLIDAESREEAAEIFWAQHNGTDDEWESTSASEIDGITEIEEIR